MTVKELREQTGLSQQKFGDYFGIPARTIQNWESGTSECNQYILDMMEYKLKGEGMIEIPKVRNQFKVEATIVMGQEMTVDTASECIMKALEDAGVKSFILDVQ